MDALAPFYLWLKAAHVVFVIFWMAGLLILPRYLVHHQEALGTPEAAQWIDRETKLRRMILTPSIIATWLLGLTIATVGQHWQEGWLHAKLLFVLLLTGYHGWAVGYAKKLAAGIGRMSSKTLRMINELPALLLIVIVILVVVKPL